MGKTFDNTGDLFPGIVYKKLSKEELNINVKIAKLGDEHAFEEILRHLYNYIVRIPNEFFIQGSQKQDLIQEASIKLLNIIETYDESKGSFISFAQSSIRKHIITMVNKETAKKRQVLNHSFSLDGSTKNEDGEVISYIDQITNKNLTKQENLDPLDIVQKDYEEYLVSEISKHLSEMETKVFVLRFIKSYSYKEIAEELKLYKINKRSGRKRLDCKSIDNSVCRSKPKIKKALYRLNITTDLFDEEIKNKCDEEKEEKIKKKTKKEKIEKTEKKIKKEKKVKKEKKEKKVKIEKQKKVKEVKVKEVKVKKLNTKKKVKKKKGEK